MRTRRMYPAFLCLCLLAGCGGGGGTAITNTSKDRGNDGTVGTYAITDLGAESYYYGYYYSPNFGLYRSPGTIAINAAGQIVSSTTGRAYIYKNGKITNLGKA